VPLAARSILIAIAGTVFISAACPPAFAAPAQARRTDRAHLDAGAIAQAAGTKATVTDDGTVRIGWSRDDVRVKVDGIPFPPAAGLGSWAAFKATEHGAMVMGDTVVFRDEVDAAMDAAFAHGLKVTSLHNHFFFDEPKVYFMHIDGQGNPEQLAGAVKAMWDAIKHVRAGRSQPAGGFGGATPTPGGTIDADRIATITGLKAAVKPGGVVKISTARQGRMHGVKVGGSMGLGTWAAFVGRDDLASIDGDFIMTGYEVRPVLKALRHAGIHIVALHNHMIGEKPAFYFTHFWAKGTVNHLARGFKAALDAQIKAANSHKHHGEREEYTRKDRDDDEDHDADADHDEDEHEHLMFQRFDDAPVGRAPHGWKVGATHPSGEPNPWSVRKDESAPSAPHVLALAKIQAFHSRTFNLCWTDKIRFDNGKIEVKVKAGTGEVDQGGGPMWRVRDENNYYVVRWNPLEDNFRLYYVKAGRRVQLAGAEVHADPGKWHTIEIRQKGDKIKCYFDGRKLLKAKDQTLTDAGGVGLWTKSDAATSFDDFKVEAHNDHD